MTGASPPAMPRAGVLERFYRAYLARPGLASLVLAVLTALAAASAARIRKDFSIEHYFPAWNVARADYDRLKADFPAEDATALVVAEATDLLSGPGLQRLQALERDLEAIADVRDVVGLASVDDVAAEGEDAIRLSKLVPKRELTVPELSDLERTVETDPLFRWNLVAPGCRATTIRVTLRPEAARTDAGRQRFARAARAVLAGHETAHFRLTLSGLPIVRADYVELTDRDLGRLLPAVLVLILVLLYAAFRDAAAVGAAFAAVLAAIVWTLGAVSAVGFPLTELTSLTPILVSIITVSDASHIIAAFRERLKEGAPPREALVATATTLFVPCLLTEVTIAAGFLTLLAMNIVAAVQFGVTTAMGMLLAFGSSLLVLPLVLEISRISPARARRGTMASRAFGRTIAGIEALILRRPRAVLVAAAAVLACGLVAASRIQRLYFAFDNLRPDSPVLERIRRAEAACGGILPLYVYAESEAEEAMHEPAALWALKRCEEALRAIPEIQAVQSFVQYIEKAERILRSGAGEAVAQRWAIPATREAVAGTLLLLDDGKVFRDLLSFDHRRAVVAARLPDVGSRRLREIVDSLKASLRSIEAPGVRLALTGTAILLDDVFRSLVDGLAASFAGAIAVSLLVFSAVLRSARLGLVGLVPNVSPMVLTLAFMGLAGIALKPQTAFVFSIALTIADDDTIQFLARFRDRLRTARAGREADDDALYREAAIGTLRETGLPMFVTSIAVAGGFLCLTLSQFLAIAHIGLLVSVTLVSAVLADVFLSPILVMRVRPLVRTRATVSARTRGG